MTKVTNSQNQIYYSIYMGNPLHGFKIDPELLLQFKKCEDVTYKIKIDKLNLRSATEIIYDMEIDEDQSRSRSVSFQQIEPLGSIKASPLHSLKRLLEYDENDNVFYQEFFKLTEMMSQLQDFSEITEKLSKDIMRTENVPNFHGMGISELFQNIQIENFIRTDLQRLNSLLFEQFTTIDFQLDCLMLFFITEIVAFRIHHFEQGYTELVAIVLTLFVEYYVAENEIIDEDKLILFLAENAQLSLRLITKFEPALHEFNLSETRAEEDLRAIQNNFMSTLKTLDKRIYKIITQEHDIQPLFLEMMDWNCSAFTRVFGFSATLFSFWGEAIKSDEICEVFIGRDVKVFIKLCQAYFNENSDKIDNFVEFLISLKKIRIEWI